MWHSLPLPAAVVALVIVPRNGWIHQADGHVAALLLASFGMSCWRVGLRNRKSSLAAKNYPRSSAYQYESESMWLAPATLGESKSMASATSIFDTSLESPSASVPQQQALILCVLGLRESDVQAIQLMPSRFQAGDWISFVIVHVTELI